MAEIAVIQSEGRGGALAPTLPSAAKAITPSDTDTYSRPIAVFVGVTGDVAIVPWVGDRSTVVVFKGIPAGSVVPCLAYKVMSTNTTATGMVALS